MVILYVNSLLGPGLEIFSIQCIITKCVCVLECNSIRSHKLLAWRTPISFHLSSSIMQHLNIKNDLLNKKFIKFSHNQTDFKITKWSIKANFDHLIFIAMSAKGKISAKVIFWQKLLYFIIYFRVTSLGIYHEIEQLSCTFSITHQCAICTLCTMYMYLASIHVHVYICTCICARIEKKKYIRFHSPRLTSALVQALLHPRVIWSTSNWSQDG